MYLRKLIAVFLCFIVLVSVGIQVRAEQNNVKATQKTNLMPFMVYILDARANLSVSSSGQATASSYILGDNKTLTKTEIKTELQYYINGKWVTRNTWNSSSNTNYAALEKSTQLSKGYLYRAVSTVTAYSGSFSETQIVVSSEIRY